MGKLHTLLPEPSFLHCVMKSYAALNSPRCHHVVHKTASANHACKRYGLKNQSQGRVDWIFCIQAFCSKRGLRTSPLGSMYLRMADGCGT